MNDQKIKALAAEVREFGERQRWEEGRLEAIVGYYEGLWQHQTFNPDRLIRKIDICLYDASEKERAVMADIMSQTLQYLVEVYPAPPHNDAYLETNVGDFFRYMFQCQYFAEAALRWLESIDAEPDINSVCWTYLIIADLHRIPELYEGNTSGNLHLPLFQKLHALLFDPDRLEKRYNYLAEAAPGLFNHAEFIQLVSDVPTMEQSVAAYFQKYRQV
jgi:hypothetical protein